ncbi:MAG: CvpA family protein [Capnocytophaga sp.]|nr:CvpA family protein [Capnocytophaga sp.]
MNTLDIILGIVLGYGLVRGIWKGLIIEAASLVAIVLGIYGAIHFSFYTSDFLSRQFTWNPQTIKMVSFVLTLIVIMLAVMLVGKLLTQIAKMVALGIFNRLLGGVFGLLKMAIVAGALLMVMDKTRQTVNWISDETINQSVLYAPVKAIGVFAYSNIFKEDDPTPPAEETPQTEQQTDNHGVFREEV